MLRRRSAGSARKSGNRLGVLVRLDDVVDPEPVDVGSRASSERAGRHLSRDLGHRVGVLGHGRVLLVHGDVVRPALSLREAHAVRRLRGGEDDLADPERGGRLEDVVGAEDVGCVGPRVRRLEDGGDRREVHDGVVGGPALQVELGHPRQPCHRRVGLTRVGEVDREVGDRGVSQRHEVGVGDVVTLVRQVGDDVLAGLATAAGEEDPHEPIQPPAGRDAGLRSSRSRTPVPRRRGRARAT